MEGRPIVCLRLPTPGGRFGCVARRDSGHIGADAVSALITGAQAMRKLFRILTPILAATAIALSSGSAVLAAASSESDSLNTSWCFQDVTMRYCFDVTGHVHYLDNKAGESLTLQQTTITKVYEGDVYQGESKSVEQLRGVFADDGTVVMSSRVHTRSRVGEEDCVYHMVLKIVDYEITVDHTTSTCGAGV
jgi:hypothetical protein